MNILQLPNPEEYLPERWRNYAKWLACQANPSLSYIEHAHVSNDKINLLKQDFEQYMKMGLDDYIRLRRIGFVLSRSQSHSQYRSELIATILETPFGQMLAIFSEKGLCLLKFVEQKGVESELLAVQREKQALFIWKENNQVTLLNQELNDYFAGKLTSFSVIMDFVGSEQQREVWQNLPSIAYGETQTYAQQAVLLGKMNATRIVASAVSQNKISILLPCHRIVGNEHQGKNKQLLELEKKHLSTTLAVKLEEVNQKNVLPPPVPFACWGKNK